MNNIQGRSVRLDILAVEHENCAYNISFQPHQVHGVFGNVQFAQHGFFRCCKYGYNARNDDELAQTVADIINGMIHEDD